MVALVTRCYKGLQEVTGGDEGLQGVRKFYMWLQRGLQEVTGGYRWLQMVTSCYRGLQGVTRCTEGYKGLLVILILTQRDQKEQHG